MSVVNVTKESFENEIRSSEKYVLLDFWAEWCGPSRMKTPTVDEIPEEYEDLLVGKVNVDEEPELAQSFGIVSIPTIVALKDGKLIGQTVGFCPKDKVLALIK